ncbi:MAG: hypothetical protein L0H93_12980 [Nocardioides sp.]|nr:hypothetical protein [Nocardioides sp.]
MPLRTPVKTLIALLAALGLMFGLTACGGSGADSDSGSTKTGDSPRAQDTSPGDVEGDSLGDKQIPGWMAAAFPIYPNAEIAASAESGETTIVSFSTPESDDQVLYSWFLEHYAQAGWTIENMDEVHSKIDANHTSGHTVSINVTDGTFVLMATQGG